MSMGIWARGVEGALAELPRATGSRPNSGNFFLVFFELQQPQLGKTPVATLLRNSEKICKIG